MIVRQAAPQLDLVEEGAQGHAAIRLFDVVNTVGPQSKVQSVTGTPIAACENRGQLPPIGVFEGAQFSGAADQSATSPLVSICVSAFNVECFLRESLSSILAQ